MDEAQMIDEMIADDMTMQIEEEDRERERRKAERERKCITPPPEPQYPPVYIGLLSGRRLIL